MKIDMELSEQEVLLLTEAFESGIAEAFFAEIEEEEKNNYYENIQKLINRFGLDVKVDEIIDELIELNENPDEEFDDEIDIDDE